MIKSWLKLILINGGILMIIYQAIWSHNKAAENAIVFVVWVLLIASLSVVPEIKEKYEALKEMEAKAAMSKSMKLLHHSHYAMDGLAILAFASAGWFVTAAAYLIMSAISGAYRECKLQEGEA